MKASVINEIYSRNLNQMYCRNIFFNVYKENLVPNAIVYKVNCKDSTDRQIDRQTNRQTDRQRIYPTSR